MNTGSPVTRGRLLAISILIGLCVLAPAAALSPVWLSYRSNDARIQDLRMRQTQLERIASRRESLESEIKRLSSEQPSDRFYLENTTPALAAAELQALISKVVANAKGTVVSTQPLPINTEKLLPRVRLRVKITGKIETLRNVIHQLESGTPYLLIDELSVTSQASRINRVSKVSLNKPLNVVFTLSGYMRPST